MTRPGRRVIASLLTLGLIASVPPLHATTGLVAPVHVDGQEAPPNIVLIFTDDQGYQDLGCFGATKIQTPNIDRMAEEGIVLRDFYAAAPTCTQSRAALLTGCYPKRVGLTGVLFPKAKIGLHPDEVTIAEVLKTKGYATACIGKWHVGDEAKFRPLRQGFDLFFGVLHSNNMRTSVKGTSGVSLWRGDRVIEHPTQLGTLTKRYTEEAVRFIEDNRDRPFFLYLPHTMPHIPIRASAEFLGKSKGGLYGDVIEEIDWSVGRILETLRELDLDARTLVLFTSDNGPDLFKKGEGGCADPLRGGKQTTWEGGMRVPFVARWPGRIPAGSESKEAVMTIDLLPTFAALAGAKLPDDRVIDGKTVLPILMGEEGASTPHEALFYYRASKLEAVRSGNWKLHFPRRESLRPGKSADSADAPASTGAGEEKQKGKGKGRSKFKYKLFDLAGDVSESKNVAKDHPEVVERLSRLGREFDERVTRDARPYGTLK